MVKLSVTGLMRCAKESSTGQGLSAAVNGSKQCKVGTKSENVAEVVLDALVRFHPLAFRQHANGLETADRLGGYCTRQVCVERVGETISTFLFELSCLC